MSLAAHLMQVALSFPEGPTETSESFVLFYRNQFGVVCWAWRDAEDMAGLLTVKTQGQIAKLVDSGDWPAGSGAGAWFDG